MSEIISGERLDLQQRRLIRICWACVGHCVFGPANDRETISALEELV